MRRHTLDQAQVSRQDKLRFKLKIDGEQLDDLFSYNQLMDYLEDVLTLGNMKIDSINSSLSQITDAHALLQTQNILEVVTTHSLNGKLGR